VASTVDHDISVNHFPQKGNVLPASFIGIFRREITDFKNFKTESRISKWRFYSTTGEEIKCNYGLLQGKFGVDSHGGIRTQDAILLALQTTCAFSILDGPKLASKVSFISLRFIII
jgi:hypothetical protein